MKQPENKLWRENEELLASMEGHYFSDNEKVFFEKIRYKMEYEDAPSNDLIMFEEDNDDHIYIVRCYYDEFIVGHGLDGNYDEELHVMKLFRFYYQSYVKGYIVRCCLYLKTTDSVQNISIILYLCTN